MHRKKAMVTDRTPESGRDSDHGRAWSQFWRLL